MTNMRNSIDSKNEPPILHTFADCKKICETIPIYLARAACEAGCAITNPYGSQPKLQVSEKLADSAKNLYDESKKLLLIEEEIHNQDLMYL